MRQHRVTVIHTGEVWLVNGPEPRWHNNYRADLARALSMHEAFLSTHVVPRGQETPLPFDEIPLRIKGPCLVTIARG